MSTTITDWVGAREACRIIGASSNNKIYALVVHGRVAVKLEPGVPPRYLRADLERLAAADEGRK